jgi:hypothetical protein
MRFRSCVVAVVLAGCWILAAQTPPAEDAGSQSGGWLKPAEEARPGAFVIPPGTRIPLSMINSVSTKHSAAGDRVYLETVFPILSNGRVVIPPGSYVAGTLTHIKRPGRVKGRGELFLRFDSLTLPNGVTRDFRARIGGLDGRASEDLDRTEGAIKSEGNKGGDARTIGEATAAGASVGVIAGGATGHYGMGAAVGAAAGAAAGLMGVLLTRGPEAMLAKGTTLEMLLDRPLSFEEAELDFRNSMPRANTDSGGPLPSSKHQPVPMPGRNWPW